MKTYLGNKYSLTGREAEVLKLVIKGYTNNEIAKLLNISTHTVKAHVSSLLDKFSVKSRVSLAVKVVRELLLHNIDIEDEIIS